MKKIILLSVLAISLSVSAKKIPAENLANASQYIESISNAQGQALDVKFNNGEMNEQGQITKLNITTKSKEGQRTDIGNLVIEAGVKLDDDKINFTLSVAGNMKENMASFNTSMIIMMAQNYVNKINEQGDYKASIEAQIYEQTTKMKLTIVPNSDGAESIDKVVITASVNPKSGDVSFKLDASLNTSGDLVVEAQNALTSIFTKLLNKQEPTEQDYQALQDVISEMGKSIEN